MNWCLWFFFLLRFGGSSCCHSNIVFLKSPDLTVTQWSMSFKLFQAHWFCYQSNYRYWLNIALPALHLQMRILACPESELRFCWMKSCSTDNPCTTADSIGISYFWFPNLVSVPLAERKLYHFARVVWSYNDDVMNILEISPGWITTF